MDKHRWDACAEPSSRRPLVAAGERGEEREGDKGGGSGSLKGQQGRTGSGPVGAGVEGGGWGVVGWECRSETCGGAPESSPGWETVSADSSGKYARGARGQKDFKTGRVRRDLQDEAGLKPEQRS